MDLRCVIDLLRLEGSKASGWLTQSFKNEGSCLTNFSPRERKYLNDSFTAFPPCGTILGLDAEPGDIEGPLRSTCVFNKHCAEGLALKDM